MDECVFCKIANGEIESKKIYEDDDFFSFLDIKPVNIGHTLIIPKKHFLSLFEIPDELLAKMFIATKKLAKAVKSEVKAEGINIGMNNGSVAGQLVNHAHIHIIPRFKNDGHAHWRGNISHTEKEMEEISKKIKANL